MPCPYSIPFFFSLRECHEPPRLFTTTLFTMAAPLFHSLHLPSSLSHFRPVSISSSVPPLSVDDSRDRRNGAFPRYPSSHFLRFVKSLSPSAKVSGTPSGGPYLQSRGIGMALLSLTYSARGRMSPVVAMLAANPTFVAGLLAWFVALSMKVVLNMFVEKTLDLRMLLACGGMPCSHAALCAALTTSVALCHGVADSLFPVCLGFSSIVMYDAIGVRRHAGMQAEVLNMIVKDLFEGHPIRQRKKKLKELLGHTPLQVLGGALLGVLVACFCHRTCLVPP